MMSDVKNSHLTKLYTDAFATLIKNKLKWPEFFTLDMKKEVIQHHLDFWEFKEDFRKCSPLQKRLKELNENRLNNKNR